MNNQEVQQSEIATETPKEAKNKKTAVQHPGCLLTQEVFATLGLNAINLLAEAYSPGTVFLRTKHLKNEEVDEALAAIGAELPLEEDFVLAVSVVFNVCNESGEDALRRHNLFRPQGSRGQSISTAYLEHPEFVRELEAQFLTEDGVPGTFSVFEPTKVTDFTKLNSLSAKLLKKAEAECRRHFVEMGYGPFAQLRLIKTGSTVGFMVAHGGTRIGKAAINSHEKFVPRNDRYQKNDIVYYNSETQCFWVSAGKKDTEFYRRLLCSLIFGIPNVFEKQRSNNLKFMVRPDLKDALLQLRSEHVKEVRLRLRKITNTPDEHTQSVKRNECVTTARDPIPETLINRGRLAEAKLTVVLNKPKSPQFVIHIKEFTLRIPKHIPDEALHAIIFGLEIMRKP